MREARRVASRPCTGEALPYRPSTTVAGADVTTLAVTGGISVPSRLTGARFDLVDGGEKPRPSQQQRTGALTENGGGAEQRRGDAGGARG